jgi:hypothetical protein
MNELKYIVISPSEDGTSTEFYTREGLNEMLEDKEGGENLVFLDKIPDNMDTNYWKYNTYLIVEIKGVITPTVKLSV